MQYIGDGSAWVDGIPARDLTNDEWAALTDDQRLHAVASGLYESEAVEAAIADAAQIEPVADVVEPSQPIESPEVD